MKIIYANIVWFAVLIYGLLNSAYGRHNSESWNSMADVRLNYDLLYGGVALLLLVTIVGLLLRKKWGYEFAKSCNCTIGILPVALFLASLVAVPELGVYKALEANAQGLLAGVLSLVFFVCLFRSGVKSAYAQENM